MNWALSAKAGACLLAAAAAFQVGGEDRRREEATRAVEARLGRMEAELNGLPGHPWAGSYYQGDGLGANLTLTLAPRAGAAYQWHGCLGLYDQNHGPVSETEGRLTVEWAFPGGGFARGTPREYLLVRWGQRRYLVPTAEVLEFCRDALAGREPRDWRLGRYYLRVGDEGKPATGQPVLPKGFERYWSLGPIRAAVTAAGPAAVRRVRIPEEQEEVTLAVTLGAGAAEGVLPGMVFGPEGPRPEGARARVVRVREHESEAAVDYLRRPGEDLPPPGVGWRVRTPER